jgi:dTDP-4-amino-4,6-dideoxy-D-galactose acyltransferase
MTGDRVATTLRLLPWDSEFFGYRIGRLDGNGCTAEGAAALLAECRAQGIDCVYVLAATDDDATMTAMIRAGALLVDTRVTCGRASPGLTASSANGESPTVRPARGSDLPGLKAIASRSHRGTRFYADPHFDRQRCDRLYELWIERSCEGFASAVFVSENEADGAPSGYVTCHLDEPARGHIGLFAVDERCQGRGHGRALIDAALGWFASRGVGDVSVATQLRNVRALRFYGRAGLAIRSAEHWFHLWPADRPGGAGTEALRA